jgi:hypothetical protein
VDRPPHRLAELQRVAFRAHHDELVLGEEAEQARVRLVVGNVQVRLGCALEAHVVHVSHHAYDLDRPEALRVVLDEELSPHRVAVREALAHERLADDRDDRLADAVALAELASGHDRDPHGTEVAWRHHAVVRGAGDGLDARQHPQPRRELVEEAADPLVVGVVVARERQPHAEGVRVEARLDPHHRVEAPEQ